MAKEDNVNGIEEVSSTVTETESVEVEKSPEAEKDDVVIEPSNKPTSPEKKQTEPETGKIKNFSPQK